MELEVQTAQHGGVEPEVEAAQHVGWSLVWKRRSIVG